MVERDPHDPFNPSAIAAMRSDTEMTDAARTFLGKTFEHGYYRNFTWLGRPIIQYPQDVIALQELIWDYRPTLIIETGVAHGGALILYASIMELIGGPGEVVGVEVEFREHNRVAVEAHPMARRIRVIEGSSTSPEIISQVADIAEKHERIMVVLDSLHTHEHVLAELRAYSKFVPVGAPLIVYGTLTGEIDESVNLNREWDQTANPKSALAAFMAENDEFEIDHEINDKLLITDAPDGYLRRVRGS